MAITSVAVRLVAPLTLTLTHAHTHTHTRITRAPAAPLCTTYLPAHRTLPHWLQCREHGHHGVVAWLGTSVQAELVGRQGDERLSRAPLHQL